MVLIAVQFGGISLWLFGMAQYLVHVIDCSCLTVVMKTLSTQLFKGCEIFIGVKHV